MNHLAASLTTLALFSAAGCGGQDPLDLGTHNSEASKLPAVRLVYAKAASHCAAQPCYGSTSGYAYGYIEVQDLAYHKQVVAHFNKRGSSSWQDAPASYVGRAGPGREVWYFETPKFSYPPRLSADFQLALRYTVKGKTYWDNNGSKNYRVGHGPRPIYPSVALVTPALVVQRAEAGGTSFRGSVVLQDLAYHKQVQVVYSTDGWATVRKAAVGYMHGFCGALDCGSSHGLQLWGWSSSIPAGAKRVQFAVSYVVNGETYWDNNFKRDYSVEVPGKLD